VAFHSAGVAQDVRKLHIIIAKIDLTHFFFISVFPPSTPPSIACKSPTMPNKPPILCRHLTSPHLHRHSCRHKEPDYSLRLAPCFEEYNYPRAYDSNSQTDNASSIEIALVNVAGHRIDHDCSYIRYQYAQV
jgi:hypothetical protein